jgi:hypothetical protein
LEATLKDLPPPLRKGQDIIRWGKKGDGNFHIKEAYREAMGFLDMLNRPSLDQSLEFSTVDQNHHLSVVGNQQKILNLG